MDRGVGDWRANGGTPGEPPLVPRFLGEGSKLWPVPQILEPGEPYGSEGVLSVPLGPWGRKCSLERGSLRETDMGGQPNCSGGGTWGTLPPGSQARAEGAGVGGECPALSLSFALLLAAPPQPAPGPGRAPHPTQPSPGRTSPGRPPPRQRPRPPAPGPAAALMFLCDSLSKALPPQGWRVFTGSLAPASWLLHRGSHAAVK